MINEELSGYLNRSWEGVLAAQIIDRIDSEEMGGYCTGEEIDAYDHKHGTVKIHVLDAFGGEYRVTVVLTRAPLLETEG